MPSLPPRNFIIKLKSRCSSNNDKEMIRRFLDTTVGVHSVKVDPDGETVAISGRVKPTEIVTLLKQGLGLKATLFWEVSTGQSLMKAKDIYRLFASRRENGTNVSVNLKNIQNQGSVEIELSVKRQNDDLKSIGGGIGLFGVSSSCCGSFAVALVHVPVSRKMYTSDIGCGNDHSSSNHSNNLQYSPPPRYIPPPSPGLPPPWSGGYAPSAPPMEVSENLYHAPPPPPPPPPPPHTPAMGGSFEIDDEYYFDAPPPVPEPDEEMFDSISDQSSDDEYPTTSCMIM